MAFWSLGLFFDFSAIAFLGRGLNVVHFHFFKYKTRTRSRWGAIANPPAKFLTPAPPSDHDPGDRMKISSDMFYNFNLWEHIQSLV